MSAIWPPTFGPVSAWETPEQHFSNRVAAVHHAFLFLGSQTPAEVANAKYKLPIQPNQFLGNFFEVRAPAIADGHFWSTINIPTCSGSSQATHR